MQKYFYETEGLSDIYYDVYYDKRFTGLTNRQIQKKHGISVSRIYKICERAEEAFLSFKDIVHDTNTIRSYQC